MADQLSISRLESLVDRTSKQVDRLETQMSGLKENVKEVDKKVENISKELHQLREEFIKLVREEQKRHILQKAGTELIRVRQEIEDKFGKYKEVRETMLGVLQATDAALVRQTTISKVSEEIMLATPKYWLSPCLVAISAWIANDRTLAERAIKVAMSRDKEKTALVMALICRRNGRTDTCYEWLNIYFSTQNARKFTQGTYTVVSAYLNGIFGDDKRHLCNGYVEKWLKDILNNETEKKQENQWLNHYENNYFDKVALNYPELSKVEEFNHISSYLKRIASLNSIKNDFSSIANSSIDMEELKEKIDKELISLVNRYDEEEIDLRNEEMHYQAIKELDGDEEKARMRIETMRLQREAATKDFLAQLSSAFDRSVSKSNADKKTALKFVGRYAQNGLNKYIQKGKEEFPNEITISSNNWTKKINRSSSLEESISSYTEYMKNKAAKDVDDLKLSGDKRIKSTRLLSYILGGIGIPLLFLYGVGIIFLGIAAYIYFYNTKKIEKEMNEACNKKIKDYEDMANTGIEYIKKLHYEWDYCLNSVEKFEKNKDLTLLKNIEVA